MEAEVYKAIDKINEQYLLCDHDFTRPYHDKEFIANLNYFKLVWPEVDTIRFAIPSGHAFDVPRFVQNEFKSQISTIQRRFDENGNPAFDVFGRPDFVTMWAKCRIDEMNKSSYGKMQIFQGKLGSDFDKNAPIALIIAHGQTQVYFAWSVFMRHGAVVGAARPDVRRRSEASVCRSSACAMAQRTFSNSFYLYRRDGEYLSDLPGRNVSAHRLR